MSSPVRRLLGAAALCAAIAIAHLALGGDDVAAPAATAARSDSRPAAEVPGAIAAAQPREDGTTMIEVGGLVEEPRGRLVLEGQVVDADEQPVGGAQVAVDTRPPRVVHTEDDGSFSIAGLLPRDYQVIARHGDRAAGPAAVSLGVDTEPVILRLRERGRVEVTVIDERGGAVSGARVALRGLDAPALTTDGAGHAGFDGVIGGTYVLAVDADGHAPARETHAFHGRVGVTESARIALRRGVPVRGSVRASDGRPIAGARVIAMDAGASVVPAATAHDGAVSDATGAWALPAVPPGHVRLVAIHPEYPVEVGAPVTVASAAIDGVELRLQAGCRLRGTVRTSTGEPAVGARITASPRGASSGDRRTAGSDDRGAFVLGGLRPGELQVMAEATGATARVAARCEPGAAPDVSLVLDRAATVRGVVVTADAVPVPEASILARPVEAGAPYPDVTATADNDGGFTLRGLPAGGRYLLYAARPGDSPRGPGARALATAAAGEGGVRLVLEPGRSLRGRVVIVAGAGAGPAQPFTIALDGAAPVPFGNRDGAFAIRGVVPGEHRVVVDGPGLRRRVVLAAVPRDRDLDLGAIEVAVGRRLTGRVVDTVGSPVPGAHVVGGERILGDATRAARFGAAEALGTREAVSGVDGAFVLTGLPDGPVMVIADHAERGRSRGQVVAGADPIVLALEATGRLQGRVIDGDRGVAGVPVLITPRGEPRAALTAVTDSRGELAVLSLPAGDYDVVAMLGSEESGHATATARASVAAGAVARVELVVSRGGVTLRLDARFDGAVVPAGQLVLAGDGRNVVALLGEQRPVVVAHVEPGRYQACVVPVSSPERVASDDELRKARCAPLTIAAAPAEQSVVLDLPTPH